MVNSTTCRHLASTLGVLLGLLFPGAHASDLRKPTKPMDGRIMVLKTENPEAYVRVESGIHAQEWAGALKSMLMAKSEFRTAPGTHPVKLAVRAGEHEWLLVPARRLLNGVDPPASGVTVDKCSTRYSNYLALRSRTRDFEPYSFSVREFRCNNGQASTSGFWDRALALPIKGKVRIVQREELQRERDLAGVQRMHEATRRVQEEAASAPLKRRIGAKLCKVEGQHLFVGFTESVSPDMDRIQVRVVSAYGGLSMRQRDASFREQVLWDNPIHWSLCD